MRLCHNTIITFRIGGFSNPRIMKLLSHIKKDMEFNNSLYSLVEVLIAISISQYRILDKKTKSFEKLFSALESFFGWIDMEGSNHP